MVVTVNNSSNKQIQEEDLVVEDIQAMTECIPSLANMEVDKKVDTAEEATQTLEVEVVSEVMPEVAQWWALVNCEIKAIKLLITVEDL